ncbi:MAG: PAS domain S-box protein [Thermoleophilia bacterium]
MTPAGSRRLARHLTSARVALAIGLAVVLATGASVGVLRQRADDSREAQVLVERLEASASRLSAIESQALHGTPAGAADAAGSAAETQATLDATLERLIALRPGSEELRSVHTASRTYADGVTRLLALLAAGDRTSAVTVEAVTVQPAYQLLSEAVAVACEVLDADAATTIRRADLGQGVAIGVALLLVAALAVASRRAGRREQAALAEQAALRRQASFARTVGLVERDAREAATVEEAMRSGIDRICALLGWPVGHACEVTADGALVPLDIWHLDDAERFCPFVERTGRLALAGGDALTGPAIEERRGHWLAGADDAARFERGAAAKASGLRSGLAIPLEVDGRVVAVIETFTTQRLAPDPELLDSVAQLGGQLARALELTQAEQAAREATERYRATLETANDAFVSIDGNGRICEWNRAAERMFGWARGDVLGQLLCETIVPTDVREAYRAEIRAYLEPSESLLPARTIELPALRRDASIVPTETTVWPTASGGELRLNAFMRDLTERRSSEEQLSRAQARYRGLVESLPLVTYVSALEDDGPMLWVSPQIEAALGYPVEAWLTGPGLLQRALHPDDRERVLAERRRAHRALEPFHCEYRLVGADGRVVWVRDEDVKVLDDDGQLVARGFLVDVTEARELEEQLLQSQKMDAIGRLAGGVAHDFNNLLTAIHGYASFALMELGDDHPVADDLDEVVRASTRAASLTRQLLAFSRQQVLQPTVLDLDDVVHDLGRMLHRLIGEDVELSIRTLSSAGRIRADRGQVEQVLLNLVVNARDAMPGGGRLGIETALVELDAGAARRADLEPGRYVTLSVVDTGVGMDAVVRGRIFEPFFTTKEPGSGTGLGLATVYGIARQSGGHVEVESEPGRGARFTVYLPACSVEGAAEPAAPAGAPGGRERILLVEDDAVVRELSRRSLERHGYEVLLATDGQDALEAFAAASTPIDLLVTDVVMPRLGGHDLALALRATRPGLRALFVSGYTDRAFATDDEAGLGDDTGLLMKPYAPDQLALAVRAVLDGDPAGQRTTDHDPRSERSTR